MSSTIDSVIRYTIQKKSHDEDGGGLRLSFYQKKKNLPNILGFVILTERVKAITLKVQITA